MLDFLGEKGWFAGGSGALWWVGEECWFAGGSDALWRVGEEGWSSECWTTMGKSMSIAGKISCSRGEDCIWDGWQNGKTLTWKVTSRLVKIMSAFISHNLYPFLLRG